MRCLLLFLIMPSVAACSGDFAEPAADAPEAIADFAATAVAAESVTVTWTQVGDGQGNPASYALAYGSPTLTENWALQTGVAILGTGIGDPAQHTFRGLQEETRYQIQAVAFRGSSISDAVVGPPSALVDTVTLTLLRAGAASATPLNGRVELTATGATGGVAPITYQWHRETTSGFTPAASNALAGATSLSVTDSTVSNGTTYYYQLVASDAQGSTEAYNQVVATPSAVPGVPGQITDLAASWVTPDSVTLSWTQVDNGQSGPASYVLAFGSPTLDPAWTLVDGVGVLGSAIGDPAQFTFRRLSEATDYEFQAVAIRGHNLTDAVEGPRSNLVDTATYAVLRPGSATATGRDGEVWLSATAATGGAPPLAYQWYRDTVSAFVTSPSTALAGLTTLDETDTTVVNDTTYYYRLAATDDQGTQVLYEQVSSTPSALHPNEPDGFVEIASTDFSIRVPTGWAASEENGGTYSIISELNAPYSPPSIGEFFFPQGFTGGVGGGTIRYRFPTADLSSRVYVEIWFKMGVNFQGGASSGTNKMGFISGRDTNNNSPGNAFIRIEGGNDDPLQFQVALQGGESANIGYDYPANEVVASQADGEVIRGQWHHAELYLRGNTPGDPNGEIHIWLDGTKIVQVTNANITPTVYLNGATPVTDSGDAGRAVFGFVNWSSTWGSALDTAAVDMYTYIDDLYISRSP